MPSRSSTESSARTMRIRVARPCSWSGDSTSTPPVSPTTRPGQTARARVQRTGASSASIADADSSALEMKPSAELRATSAPKSVPSRLDVRITWTGTSSRGSRSAISNPSTSGSWTSRRRAQGGAPSPLQLRRCRSLLLPRRRNPWRLEQLTRGRPEVRVVVDDENPTRHETIVPSDRDLRSVAGPTLSIDALAWPRGGGIDPAEMTGKANRWPKSTPRSAESRHSSPLRRSRSRCSRQSPKRPAGSSEARTAATVRLDEDSAAHRRELERRRRRRHRGRNPRARTATPAAQCTAPRTRAAASTTTRTFQAKPHG